MESVKAVRIGPEGEPKHSLADEILDWTIEYLRQPDGPSAGEMWQFTPEQFHFLSWWYGVDDTGRFTYRYGMLRRMKGWGKDPLAAALSLIEFVGPCRFSHWENGKPRAKPHEAAWVQIAAVSREQTRNTMTLFPGMLSKEAIEEYEIDLGKEIIYAFHGRRRLEAVTSSPRALEGGRATFTLKNESHHWLAPNEGHEMSNVIARNAAKSRDGSSRVLAISNAHAPGENSDAEHDWEAHRKGTTDMLYDSLEAPETDLEDEDSLRNGLLAARGDSHWVNIDRLMAEIRDPRTSPAMARRFYLNQITAVEDKPFPLDKWELLERNRKVPLKAMITLGFDGSRTRDHTALIATEIESGYQFVVGYWEPVLSANGDFGIPMDEVNQTVEYAFQAWDVRKMNVDPSYWGSEIAAWSGTFGKDRIVGYYPTQYRRMALSLAQYRAAIVTGRLTHDGDKRFTASIANSVKHMQSFRDDDGELMWTIQKERPDSPLKIDAAIAGCLSWQAALDVIAEGLPGPSVYERRGLRSI